MFCVQVRRKAGGAGELGSSKPKVTKVGKLDGSAKHSKLRNYVIGSQGGAHRAETSRDITRPLLLTSLSVNSANVRQDACVHNKVLPYYHLNVGLYKYLSRLLSCNRCQKQMILEQCCEKRKEH